MSSRVYGESDDLIEFEGELSGEVECYSSSGDPSCLLVFSDGFARFAQLN